MSGQGQADQWEKGKGVCKLTIEEKRRAIKDYCESKENCDGCPLLGLGVKCYTGADNETVEQNYDILFSVHKQPNIVFTTHDDYTKHMTREFILDTAKQMVCGHRETDYGKPEDNFGIIASLWTVYLNTPVTPVDVAMMMALLKIGRIKSGTATDDSFVDAAGYIACGGEIATRKEK